MSKAQWITGAAATLLFSLSAKADIPRVAADITPVHSLVAQVMKGVGEPDLLVQSGASPHTYSLSPSEAEALQEADLVFWVGEGLTPWLESPLDKLSGDARTIELLEVPGTTTYSFREGATFEKHHHHGEHEDGEGDEHEGEHHDEHDANHSEDGGHHEHHHEGLDPHAWLDPANAKIWLGTIADALSKQDPEHASQYAENAEAGKRSIDEISSDVEATIDELGYKEFIVFHDAYQYFEKHFGIAAAGAISIGDASKPSPARIAEIRELVKEHNVSCVFTEPQYNPGIVKAVFGGTGVNTSAVMDPLGSGLETGPDLYPNLLRELADSLRSCFASGA